MTVTHGADGGDSRRQGSDLRRGDSAKNPERAFLSPRPLLKSTVTWLGVAGAPPPG